MASSVVAALPSLASRLSINRRLRVNAMRLLKSSEFSTFLSSAALATIRKSIRKASTLSFLVAGSIWARLGPSSSSASATSLCRISAPFTLASTGFASSARTGRPLSSTTARQPVTAAQARPRRPGFVSGNERVMENPYLLKMELFGAAGHSPNHVTLATRKVCQNDEILDRRSAPFPKIGIHLQPPLTRTSETNGALLKIPGPRAAYRFEAPGMSVVKPLQGPQTGGPGAVDKALAQPNLCKT